MYANDDAIFAKVKRALLSTGPLGVVSAVRLIRREPTLIPADRFQDLLRVFSVSLTKQEFDHIAKAFRGDSEGVVVNLYLVLKWLTLVSPRRLRCLEHVYEQIRTLSMRELLDQVMGLSGDPFSPSLLAHGLRGSAGDGSAHHNDDLIKLVSTVEGTMGKEDFLSFYAMISASIPSDHIFEEAVLRTWKKVTQWQTRMEETRSLTHLTSADPLEVQHPAFVKEHKSRAILDMQTTRHYDYTHAQRRSVPFPALPDVKPDYITTHHERFPKYSTIENYLAKPLSHRN